MKKGVFLSAPLTMEKAEELLALGVNEISLGWRHCTGEPLERLKHAGVKIFAEISLFVGKEWWEKYPDSRPVDREGKPMEAIHWYYGVCPNHPQVRAEQLANMDKIIANELVDGIWLDFIRYPCHWEEVRSAEITEYCFCEHCLEKYAREVGGTPEGKAWIEWKCAQITGFVGEVREKIDRSRRDLQLALFAVPWFQDDYGGGIRSIIGQDFAALSAFVDVFGVMTYHKITGNAVAWIPAITAEINDLTGKTVLPLVQSIALPEAVSGEEFADSLEAAIQPPSAGVVVFHYEDMLEDEEKVKAVRELFST